jgi:outer membrane protein
MTDRTYRFPRGAARFACALALGACMLGGHASAQADAAVSRAAQRGPLTLADVVSLALQNNPQTRVAYAQARAAAAAYGSARGRLLPTVNASAPLSRTHGAGGSSGGAQSDSTGTGRTGGTGDRTTFSPGLSLSYLLLDFGGRGGTIAAAREAAAAASEQSDATVQATILQAEGAFFAYNAARDLAEADRVNTRMAAEARDAAVARFHVGLATVADTLQASTALAQAQLTELTAEGQVQTARGNLAAAMGLSADQPFEVGGTPGPVPVRGVAESVDSLMARAVRERPELAAARAQAAAAQAQVRVARSALLPSLNLSSSAGRVFSDVAQSRGGTYGLTLGVQVPVFSGFSRQFDVRAAREQAEAARARVDVTRVQVANEVFTSYTTLQVAAGRVQASDHLLASAVESEAVARGRYSEGVGTFLEVLTAQSALAAARAQAAEARWQWQTALAQLAHDVGTLDRSGAPGLPLSNSNPTVPQVTR